jgi:hypothetical protein
MVVLTIARIDRLERWLGMLAKCTCNILYPERDTLLVKLRDDIFSASEQLRVEEASGCILQSRHLEVFATWISDAAVRRQESVVAHAKDIV